MIWRYCDRCGWLGPSRSKRCAACLGDKVWRPGARGAPAVASSRPVPGELKVLPVAVSALQGAWQNGGGDAVAAVLRQHFRVTDRTLDCLARSSAFPDGSIFHALSLGFEEP